MRLIARLAAAVLLFLCLYVAWGGAWALMNPAPEPRGRFVQTPDGRRLHVVCAGPAEAAGPVVMLESGAAGWSADWGTLQAALAERGVRSCAYDRAGLGRSDPAPGRRTGAAIADDFEAVLAAEGLTERPLVLVGHSMAGLLLPFHEARRPEAILGVVLVDAMPPEAVTRDPAAAWIERWSGMAAFSAVLARAGLYKPLTPLLGERIGLSGAARAEKRAFFGRGAHHAATAAEVAEAAATARAALDLPPRPASRPVAVVTAGSAEGDWAAAKAAPARASQRPFVRVLGQATHANLLGAHADVLVEAVEHVMHDAPRG